MKLISKHFKEIVRQHIIKWLENEQDQREWSVLCKQFPLEKFVPLKINEKFIMKNDSTNKPYLFIYYRP